MSSPRNQHYNFAYFTLPLLSLSNSNETYKKLDRSNRLDYLKSLWNGLGKKTGDQLPDRELFCLKKNLGEGKVLFVIQLPEPETQPEAIFVGLFFVIDSGIFSTKVKDVRCFTLELSKDVNTGQVVYVVGEIVKGQSFPNFDHDNFGSITRRDTEAFLGAIVDVIAKRKSSPYWYNPEKNVVQNQKAVEKVEAKISEKGDLEAELETIWSKWTNYSVEDSVQELCYQRTEPVALQLLDYGQKCLNNHLINNLNADRLEEWVGDALGRLSRGSFMVGLEFPEYADNQSNFMKSRVFQLLKEASQPAEKLSVLFLSQLAEDNFIQMNNAQKAAGDIGKLILNAMIGCYYIGAQYSPKNKGSLRFLDKVKKDEVIVKENLPSENPRGSSDNAIPRLIDGLRNPNLMEYSVKALIDMGELVIPFIRPLLKDMNPQVRNAALRVLTEIEKKNFQG